MAGISSHRMRIIVGVTEFSGLISEIGGDYAVAEEDDSVSLSDDMEYIPGQLSAAFTAGGRFTGVEGEIDKYIGQTLKQADFVAASPDGKLYDIGTIIKTSKAVSGSLGSRVNVSMGLRVSETDAGLARQIMREDLELTTQANTTVTGEVIDLEAASTAKERDVYLYYFADQGNVPPLQVRIKDSAAEAGPFTNAHTFNLTAAAINAAIAQRKPIINAASYAQDRYVQVEVVVSGVGRSGEIVILQST